MDSRDIVKLTPLSAQNVTPLSLKQRQQWIFLETLSPDTSYELQVRVRAQRGKNKTWSPWSQPLAFRTRPAGTVGSLEGAGKGPRCSGSCRGGIGFSSSPSVGSLPRDRATEESAMAHKW